MEYDIILSTPLQDALGKFCGREAPPLSLLHASSVLADRGRKVRLLDFYKSGENEDAFRQVLRTHTAPVWGITCDVTDRFMARRTAELIKEIRPETTVVLGGIFASQCYRTIMEDWPCIDIAVRGEGEFALCEILASDGRHCEHIAGISWRTGGDIIHNPPRPMINDLNALPDPDFSLLDFSRYENEFVRYGLSEQLYPLPYRSTPLAHLIFSRGCPFQCIFCSSPGQGFLTYRIIPPERAVQQIKYFHDRGFRNFIFWDDHLLLNDRWFQRFYELITGSNIKFACKISSRVDVITEQKIKMLREIGCIKLTLGVEYGEDAMLKRIGKNTTTAEIENVYRLLDKYGIIPGGGMLVNFPEETFSSITQSMAFFKKLQRYKFHAVLFPSPVQVHPGTKLDTNYWRGKYPDFRWTTPFFNKKNLFLNASPAIPLWENISTGKMLGLLIRAAFIVESIETIRYVFYELLLPAQKYYLTARDRLYLRMLILGALFLGCSDNPKFIKIFYRDIIRKFIAANIMKRFVRIAPKRSQESGNGLAR